MKLSIIFALVKNRLKSANALALPSASIALLG